MESQKWIYNLLIAVMSLSNSLNLYAVPATPYPITKTLPDGSELTVYLRGNEFFKYELTEDGYLIKEGADGYYYYATQHEQGDIQSLDVQVNQPGKRSNEEKTLLQNMKSFPSLELSMKAQKIVEQFKTTQATNSFPRTGSPKSLVILVNFQDVQFVIDNPQEAFFNLLNEEGYSNNGGTGSAKDYFKTASNGISSPDFVVVGPYNLKQHTAYYGANENSGDDIRPREMIIEACLAASEDGVDFKQFDTDGDGIVDNVFVYYAGHNEAEGANKNTIWPHRWFLDEALIIDEVEIHGYACTSELRGNKGAVMCGIGTFAHEFGHVYGLPDYYPTNGANHHTLSQWSIMDTGAYLNEGRTPPTYSAYDRFYLGWLTPTLLENPRDVVLSDLQTYNKAYLISSTQSHNLNGKNPNPNEFFMLENRQKTAWDAYLPNSGMLITRINFNVSTWTDNAPNNKELAMGVDLIEADGIADKNTLKGDPFPGTGGVTNYEPSLRDGTNIHKPITNIKQEGGVISFDFMGGGIHPQLNSNHDLLLPFNAEVGKPSASQAFSISGENLISNIHINFGFNTHFEMRLKDQENAIWTKNIELIANHGSVESTAIEIRYNPVQASLDDTDFEYLNIFSKESDFEQCVLSGISTPPRLSAPVVNKTIQTTSIQGYTANWDAVDNATGYYLTAYHIAPGSSSLTEEFELGLQAPTEWIVKAKSINESAKFAGKHPPSIQFERTGDMIQTEKYPFPLAAFSFYIQSMGATSGSVTVDIWDGSNWILLEEIAISLSLNTTKSYEFLPDKNYSQIRLSFHAGMGAASIDDLSVKFREDIQFNAYNLWTTETDIEIDLLIPGRDYFYFVKASDKAYYPNNSIKYENITAASDTVAVQLNHEQIYRYENKPKTISSFIDDNNNIILNKGKHDESNATIRIYTLDGLLVKEIESDSQMVLIQGLRTDNLYIIKVGSQAIKINL